jgi:hypothetical protein
MSLPWQALEPDSGMIVKDINGTKYRSQWDKKLTLNFKWANNSTAIREFEMDLLNSIAMVEGAAGSDLQQL